MPEIDPRQILFVPELNARANPTPDAKRIASTAETLTQDGQLQEVLVKKGGDAEHPYSLVAGAGRLFGALEVRKKNHDFKLRVRVVEGSEKTLYMMSAAENGRRLDRTPVDDAHVAETMRTKYEMTENDIASALGVSRVWVTQTLRGLYAAPAKAKKLVERGAISAKEAAAIAALPAKQQQKKLAKVDAILEKLGDTLKPTDKKVRRKVKKALGSSGGDLRSFYAEVAAEEGADKALIQFCRANTAFAAGKLKDKGLRKALDAFRNAMPMLPQLTGTISGELRQGAVSTQPTPETNGGVSAPAKRSRNRVTAPVEPAPQQEEETADDVLPGTIDTAIPILVKSRPDGMPRDTAEIAVRTHLSRLVNGKAWEQMSEAGRKRYWKQWSEKGFPWPAAPVEEEVET